MKEGQPLPNIEIGLVQISHRAETFLGEYRIGTDRAGRFELPNVAPNDRYYIYGKMNSLAGVGTVLAKEVALGADNSDQDIGDLVAQPGYRISGRVVLSDGNTLPPHTRLSIGREGAWDVQVVELDEHGRFEAGDLPREKFSIFVRVPYYHISTANPNLDRLNRQSVIGTIDRDIMEFLIVLEPGAPAVGGIGGGAQTFDQRAMYEQPLRSATLDASQPPQ